jgi:hypothetical protein
VKQESAYIILACDKPESYNLVQNKKIKEESFRSMELLSLFISSALLPFIFLLSQKEYPSRQHTAQRKQYSH